MIQGLTEFLPVSSSGHLVLGAHFAGLREPHLLFDIVLHVATLVATMVYYRRALARMALESWPLVDPRSWRRGAVVLQERPYALLTVLVVLGTVPTAIIGAVFKDPLEALFASPPTAAVMLLVTAGWLMLGAWVARRRPGGPVHWHHALVVGVVQGLAIIPGISRSGSTIACALMLGVEREQAAQFSFLLSMPAILGALVLKLADGAGVEAFGTGPLVVGFAAAAATGLLALAVLIPVVRRGRLHWFAAYLIPVAIIALINLP